MRPASVSAARGGSGILVPIAAGVAELVDAGASKGPRPSGRVGSSPTSGTRVTSRAQIAGIGRRMRTAVPASKCLRGLGDRKRSVQLTRNESDPTFSSAPGTVGRDRPAAQPRPVCGGAGGRSGVQRQDRRGEQQARGGGQPARLTRCASTAWGTTEVSFVRRRPRPCATRRGKKDRWTPSAPRTTGLRGLLEA